MADSPAHRFGQIIGDCLELVVRPLLADAARSTRLYLDWKHPRKARGNRAKVRWQDGKGNWHDLDYVLERGGTEEQLGVPKAFVEIAWRRYTKHSRNKAQEIQGAVGPLADHWHDHRPFLGVVLAGEFTGTSLEQLRSHGFEVLFIPYSSIIRAFASVGIDAEFGEDTPLTLLQGKVDAYERLPDQKKAAIPNAIAALHTTELTAFSEALYRCLQRSVAEIRLVGLHGAAMHAFTVREAIAMLSSFDEKAPIARFQRYECLVVYSNGDEIRGDFRTKADAIEFLHLAG